MDMVSYETLDANAPADLFNELNEGDNVTFISLTEIPKVIRTNSRKINISLINKPNND